MGGNYTYTFGYDNQNRLTSANTALAGASESYTYNDDGSFLTKNRSGNNLEYKYWPNNNRLKDVIKNTTDTTHYAYDTRGNIYGGFGVLKEYNYQNLPVEMMNENSETYNYNYNGNGERVKKANTGTGEGEYYLRDFSGRELVIYDNETGEIKSANIFGNGLVGKLEVNGTTDTRSYYLKDHLGNIRTVLNPSGTVTNAMDYYPYGELLRYSGQNKYNFTEKERDTESGYDYFGARYYDNKLALWLQVDPLSDKYQGWSPYNYALCNPVKYNDPDGNGPWDLISDPYYAIKSVFGGIGNAIYEAIFSPTTEVSTSFEIGPLKSETSIKSEKTVDNNFKISSEVTGEVESTLNIKNFEAGIKTNPQTTTPVLKVNTPVVNISLSDKNVSFGLKSGGPVGMKAKIDNKGNLGIGPYMNAKINDVGVSYEILRVINPVKSATKITNQYEEELKKIGIK